MDSSLLKRSLKILSHVGAKTVFDNLTISAVGLNLMGKINLDTGVTGAVATDKLAAVVSQLSGDVSISRTDGIEIKSGRAKYKLAEEPMPVQRFPETPENKISLPLTTFRDLISFAATASDSSKLYDYSGAVWVNIGKTLEAAGTDGKRLALAFAPLSGGEASAPLLIPSIAVGIIRELSGDEIVIRDSESVLFFESEGVVVGAKKLAKKFPDPHYPLENFSPTRKIKFDAANLRDALKRISPLMENDRVKITLNSDTMKLAAYGNIAGDAEDFLPIETSMPDPLFDQIPPLELKSNARHLLDFLGGVKGSVNLEAANSSSPILLVSGNFKTLIAAVR